MRWRSCRSRAWPATTDATWSRSIHEVVASGELETERVEANGGAGGVETTAQEPATQRQTRRAPVAPVTRAKLRRLLGTLDDLAARTWREGPFTILEEYVARTGLVLDLLAIDSLEAKRTIANIGSFMRFVQDWQAEHPRGCLGDFVAYLDAYQAAGGELPTSVEASEDLVGVQLMTLYQAKGLEFDHVFVPQLLKDEWPTREGSDGLFPRELLKELVPAGDIHTEEERRLLYVALTRARERLVVTTIAGPAAEKDPSPFLADLQEGAGPELRVVDGRAAAGPGALANGETPTPDDAAGEPAPPVLAPRPAHHAPADHPGAPPGPTPACHRAAGSAGGHRPRRPRGRCGPRAARGRFAALADRAVAMADEAREHQLDPLTMRVVALDSAAGASLLDVAPLPRTFSYSQMDTYGRCPLQYALQRVYAIPSGRRSGAMSFGSTAHAAFEAYTRERRERLARGIRRLPARTCSAGSRRSGRPASSRARPPRRTTVGASARSSTPSGRASSCRSGRRRPRRSRSS